MLNFIIYALLASATFCIITVLLGANRYITSGRMRRDIYRYS